MHLSHYTLFLELGENEGALFNTFSGALSVIPKRAYYSLQGEFEPRKLSDIFESGSEFIKEKYCCYANEDVEALEQKLLFNKHRKDRLTVTIMTTLACNLSCVYCYQQGLVDRSLNMTSEVAEKIKIWTINKIKENKPKEVIFHFYGGEPLINLDVLEKIMPEIMQAAQSVGAIFTSYVTTNGTLLNQKNILRLKRWNLDNAQISIDGPKEIHDVRRPLINGAGTYDRILENVVAALKEHLHVVVRVNIDKQNIVYVEDLFKEMRSRGLNEYRGLQINIEIVSPIMNPTSHCINYTFNGEDEMKALAGLWKMQVEYGFPIKSVMPIDSACENQIENSYTFSSNGDMYMCPGFIGIDDFIVGNIMDDDYDNEKYNSLIDKDVWKNCLECEYAPVCQGGCKMCAYVTQHEFGKTYCRKDFISAIYPEFIKSKYHLAAHNN